MRRMGRARRGATAILPMNICLVCLGEDDLFSASRSDTTIRSRLMRDGLWGFVVKGDDLTRLFEEEEGKGKGFDEEF